jgi:FkbM family methyltransferase
MIRKLRDKLSQRLLAISRRLATDEGWSLMSNEIGAPNMLGGLLRLRALGVSPRRVIDGGACVGDWSLLVRRVFPGASILMIEPQVRHAETLMRLCARQGTCLRFVSKLLGPPGVESASFVVMDDSGAGTGSSVLPEYSDVPRHIVDLPVATLDAVVDEQEFGEPDFLKLDVQGYEIEVLKGAAKTLEHAEFVLLEVSIWQYNQGSPLLHDVVQWMAKRDFIVFEVFDLSRRRDGALLQVDLLFVRKNSTLFDIDNTSKAA